MKKRRNATTGRRREVKSSCGEAQEGAVDIYDGVEQELGRARAKTEGTS